MRIGVFVSVQQLLNEGLGAVQEMGFDNCQLGCWDMSLYTSENAEKVMRETQNREWRSPRSGQGGQVPRSGFYRWPAGLGFGSSSARPVSLMH